MPISLYSALMLAAMLALAPAQEAKKPASSERSSSKPPKNKHAGWRRVIIQPNGWGQTKKQAVADLERVMKLYDWRPGYRRDNYVAVVYVGRNKWQADGRCSYLAPPTVKPKTEQRRRALKNKNMISRSAASKTR